MLQPFVFASKGKNFIHFFHNSSYIVYCRTVTPAQFPTFSFLPVRALYRKNHRLNNDRFCKLIIYVISSILNGNDTAAF